MYHGIYVGKDKRLHNQNSLLQDCKEDDECYLAQFDAMHLKESHGWHKLPKKDFASIINLSEHE